MESATAVEVAATMEAAANPAAVESAAPAAPAGVIVQIEVRPIDIAGGVGAAIIRVIPAAVRIAGVARRIGRTVAVIRSGNAEADSDRHAGFRGGRGQRGRRTGDQR